MKYWLIIAAAAFATVLFVAPVQAQDGKTLYNQKGCPACHGPDGSTALQPNYPKLAGQNAPYLLQQMKDIKSGARANGLTAVMKPMVAAVSEAEMQKIAEWLSQQ